jgi:hypothetical protein
LHTQAEIDAGAKRMPDVQVMLVVIPLWGEAEELLKIPMTTLAECESYARLWNAQLPGVDASCVLVQRSAKLAAWSSQDRTPPATIVGSGA